MHNTTTSDYIATFERAMAGHGLVCSDPLLVDGQLHRYHVSEDKPQTKNGWYIAFDDVLPTIVFGSWKIGEKYTCSSKDVGSLSSQDRQRHNARVQAAQETFARQREALAQEAAIRAKRIWDAASPASPDHPYLARKQVKGHGVRLYEGKRLSFRSTVNQGPSPRCNSLGRMRPRCS